MILMAKRGQGEGSITVLSNGLIQARITVGRDENGRQKRKAKYFQTKKEAKEWLTEMKSTRDKGTFVEPSKMTLNRWLDIWLKEYKKPYVRLSTYLYTYRSVHNRILPFLGKIKLQELRKDSVQSWINALKNDCTAGVTNQAYG